MKSRREAEANTRPEAAIILETILEQRGNQNSN